VTDLPLMRSWHRLASKNDVTVTGIPSLAIHKGSRLIALHLVCLALVVLSLLESSTFVAIPIAEAPSCLGIALIHCICFEPFIGVFFFVFIDVVSIDLIIEVMVSSTSTTVATRTNPSTVMNLCLLGKESDKLAQSDLI